MNRLQLISPWFGKWPAWINFFIESCKWNPEVDWLIPTDQHPPENSAPNVHFMFCSFADFKERLSSSLGVDLTAMPPYKLCDVRPFFGVVFERELSGYSHFGYCDLDIVWGDIRSIYTDKLLDQFDVISAAEERLSGHLAVFKNSRKMRNFGKSIRGWKTKLQESRHLGVDEHHFTNVIRPRGRKFLRHLLKPNAYFTERYSTPLGKSHRWSDGGLSPEQWTWKDGRLENERFSSGILYLHFMHWHSNRWRNVEDGPAPWPNLTAIVQCDWKEAVKTGFTISPKGIMAVN